MAFHRFCRSMLAGEPLVVYGDGRQSRDFTFIDDAVEVNVRAWHRAAPQGVYNVGGGSQVEVLEAIALLEQALGVKAQVRFETRPPGDPLRTRADATRLQADLDYRTTVGIADGLAAEAAWARTLYGGRA
jgi:nucleoside-diphosphate-sugar epimerase